MNTSRSLIWSSLRLIALAAFVSVGVPKAQADEEGGCSTAVDHACARVGVVYGKKCSQGSSGGCEDCVKAGPEDMCFYGAGTTTAEGYEPSSSEE